MKLPFHPRPGDILICDYSMGGFRSPEMTKKRLSVVISPKLKRRDDLASVIPLSTSAPEPVETWHVRVDISPPDPWGDIPRWGKCDMIATVGYDRLMRPYYRHPVSNARLFWQHTLSADKIVELRVAVATALGI